MVITASRLRKIASNVRPIKTTPITEKTRTLRRVLLLEFAMRLTYRHRNCRFVFQNFRKKKNAPASKKVQLHLQPDFVSSLTRPLRTPAATDQTAPEPAHNP